MTENRSPLVLIIEDNVANFVLMARLLGYAGIHVEWHRSGYEAFEMAHTLKPDLILLDLRLPYKDGYEVYKELASDEETRRIAVVVVTADDSTDQRNKALSYGAVDFLGKPLDALEFPKRIQNILRGIRLGLYDPE